MRRPGEYLPELTRTPRRLRWVRTGYAYQPPALCTYRRRRAACPQGPTYSTYWVRVPASGVGYVPRTVAPQVLRAGLLRMGGLRMLVVDEVDECVSTDATRALLHGLLSTQLRVPQSTAAGTGNPNPNPNPP